MGEDWEKQEKRKRVLRKPNMVADSYKGKGIRCSKVAKNKCCNTMTTASTKTHISASTNRFDAIDWILTESDRVCVIHADDGLQRKLGLSSVGAFLLLLLVTFVKTEFTLEFFLKYSGIHSDILNIFQSAIPQL